jgi:hypothetical protein
MSRSPEQILKKGVVGVTKAARFALREPLSALLLARMALWVAALSTMVKLMPLPRAMQLLTPLRRRRRLCDAEAVPERLARLLDTLLALDAFVFTPTCWKRAPVLYRYLALHGIESHIVFGVRREGRGLLDGHAWLESGGRPLLEKVAPAYTVTYKFPPASPSTSKASGN